MQKIKKFFKTGKGRYAEKDIFIGITVPILRKLSNKYKNLYFNELAYDK
jgi:hypothetical protein